jgi:DNA-binding transcriptional regulator GbsR (MarR family)
MSPTTTDPIRGRFIHEIGEFAASLGLSRSAGQLYTLLYMSPAPLCLDEMTQAAEMSKATASINIRELERWGAVRHAWVRGDRKDYYEANRDVAQIAMARLRDGLGRRLGAMDGVLADAERRVEDMSENPGHREFYRERLKEIRKYRNSLGRILANMDKIYAVAKRFL